MPVLNELFAALDSATLPDTVMPHPLVTEWRVDTHGLNCIVDSCLVATVELYADDSPGEVTIVPNGSRQEGCEADVLEPRDAEYFATAADAVRAVERYLGVTGIDRRPSDGAVPWGEYLHQVELLDPNTAPYWHTEY